MEPDTDSDDGVRNSRFWLLGFFVSLLALAIVWSIDGSFVYFTLAIAAFSLFKILQLKFSAPPTPQYQRKTSFERSYESVKPGAAWLFWQDVKEIFRKESSGSQSPQQARVFIALVAGFIGSIFLITILVALLSD